MASGSGAVDEQLGEEPSPPKGRGRPPKNAEARRRPSNGERSKKQLQERAPRAQEVGHRRRAQHALPRNVRGSAASLASAIPAAVWHPALPRAAPQDTEEAIQGRQQQRAWLRSIPDAPTYYPTAEEWAEPLDYIRLIQGEAARFGICKIVPPIAPAAAGGLVSGRVGGGGVEGRAGGGGWGAGD
jgi:hypothetical protein